MKTTQEIMSEIDRLKEILARQRKYSANSENFMLTKLHETNESELKAKISALQWAKQTSRKKVKA